MIPERVIPRDAGQMLATALHLGRIGPTAAKKHCSDHYGARLYGRTREAVAREICRLMKEPPK